MDDERVDVLVVGAGISGIDAAWHLQTYCPTKTYAIVEGRDDLGGTWDLFRYPGVRSDSDMHTLGFGFKPWVASKSIADGPSILEYLNETVDEHGIRPHIRFRHLARRATWSSDDATWTVQLDHDGETRTIRCGFLFVCAGYYSYKAGFTPAFAGRERFRGQIVHPQTWPEDIDLAGKRVAVIGSGATAMTLVPAIAGDAAHVTMVQRSPTYVVSRPDTDAIANRLRRFLPERLAYALTRRKNVALQQLIYKRSRVAPQKMKDQLVGMVRKELGPDYDVDTHFTPTYGPWDQRLCLIPNGDLFEAIRGGKASVVTDTIESFTETGLQLASGASLDADVIVTATGLQMVTLGEMEVVVDGEPVDFSTRFTYKGLAYSDVPNLASSFGYINASWTLRADLTCRFVTRLLNHMEETRTVQCTPRLRVSDRGMEPRPFVEQFSSGYVQRVVHVLPKQGDRDPWRHPQRYTDDRKLLLQAPIEDGVMRFTGRRAVPVVPAAAAAAAG
jgi:cation diffusion facilitator CzcD-associated flavoprotein CzcO